MRAEDRAELRSILQDALRPLGERLDGFDARLGRLEEQGDERGRALSKIDGVLEAKIPEAAREHVRLGQEIARVEAQAHSRIGRSETLLRGVGLLVVGGLITTIYSVVTRPSATAAAETRDEVREIRAQVARLAQDVQARGTAAGLPAPIK